MVLRSAALLLLLSACVTTRPAVKADATLPVAVALVFDGSTPGPVPEALQERVLSTLRERNLDPTLVDPALWSEAFATRRTSEQRLAHLDGEHDAPALLLLETTAAFYSQIGGRFRWTVHARGTLVKKGQQPLTFEDDYSAYADFDHQREPWALTVAAGRIADDVGELADRFVGGLDSVAQQPARERTDRLGSVYFVMLDRFANGDPSNDADADPDDPAAFHGGDLKGLIDRLDHLEALGIETVWVSPVFRTRTEPLNGHGAFHGYWTTDFGEVEPRFGTREDLVALTEALHARGMKLVLDVVVNHVGYEAPLVTQRPDWFHHNGDITDWNDPVQLETHDVHGLPDLAQENEEVAAYLIDASARWIDEVNPDGFRLDAVKHVPLSFWSRFNDAMRAKAGPGFVLLGEALEGDVSVLSRTMKEGRFDTLFDFPLHFATLETFCKGASVDRVASVLSLDRLYAHPERLVTLLDNHDLPRFASVCRDPAQRKAALAFHLLSRGVPSFTWGFEAGLDGEFEPENRASMIFDRLDDLEPPSAVMVAQLLRLRRTRPSLSSGDTRIVSAGSKHVVFARVSKDEAALVAVNLSDEPVSLSAPDWLSGELEAGDPVLHYLGLSALGCPPLARCDAAMMRPGVSVAFVKAPKGKTFRMPPARPVTIELVVRGAPEGRLAAVGSGPELGAWKPADAPSTRDGTVKVSLPESMVAEFKLAVLDESGDVTWEPRTNRYLHVTNGLGKVELTWSEPPAG